MARRGGLGRGLDALIPDRRSGKPANSIQEAAEAGSNSKEEELARNSLQDRVEAETEDFLKAGSDDTDIAAAALSGEESMQEEQPTTEMPEGVYPDERNPENINPREADSEGDWPGGEAPEEERPGGEAPEEERPDEEVLEEERLDGEAPEEERLDEEALEEERLDGEAPEEERPGGEAPEEGFPEGEAAFSSENTGLDYGAAEGDASEARNDQVVKMRISLVEPNREQPRKYFDDQAIEELSDSIRQFGIIQPLLVQKKDDYFEIIAGERRWRAAKKAGLKEVPVIVKNFSNQEAVEVSLIENIQREDLNPIEEAKAYDRLVREYGLSQEAVAGRVSKSRSSVTNSMRLLKLESSVQQMVETGQISEGHARAILGLPAPSVQKEMAEQVLKAHLSVRQTEKMVRDIVHPKAAPEGKEKSKELLDEAVLQDIEEKLKLSLGTRVRINQSGKKGGRIEIEYYSFDDLDRLFELLRSAHEV